MFRATMCPSSGADDCVMLYPLKETYTSTQRARITVLFHTFARKAIGCTVIPRLTKIIRSGITFVSRKVISRRFL